MKIKSNQTLSSFVIQFVQSFRWMLLGQLTNRMLWAIQLSLSPYLVKLILDKVTEPVTIQSLHCLWKLAGLYIALKLLLSLSFRVYQWLWLKIAYELQRSVSVILLDRMLDHSHGLYQNHFAGSLANKIKDVMQGVLEIVKIWIDEFFSPTLALFIAVYTLWQVNVTLSIGLIIWAISFLAVSVKTAPKASKLSEIASGTKSQSMGVLVDILSNVMSVRLFGGKTRERANYNNALLQFVQAYQRRDRFFMKIHAFQGFSFIIFHAVCLFVLIKSLQTGTVTPGDFGLVLLLTSDIADLLWNLSNNVREFAESVGSVKQGLQVINLPLEIQDSPKATELKISEGSIVFDNVQFYYHPESLIFQNHSITLKGGEKVGLVGYSGSGKSTFIHLILRIFDIKSGKILIDGQDIRDVTQLSLRNAIGMIPQDPSLFHRSIADNIRYGYTDASQEAVITAAKQAHAHDFIVNLHKGYQALVGERGVKLSGGQRQRIAIARAFLKNAPILILDEATSQLDSITENLIQDSLWKLMQNKTTIVIAHRLSTLLQMDRIVVFDEGKIIEDGTHLELLEKGGLYKTLWTTQAGGFLPY
jgi:ATP-binding cassette subfamily B protein